MGGRARPHEGRTRPGASAEEALLAFSRDLATASSEEELTRGVARALATLFPGRAFAVRLVHPESLALLSLHASGRLRSAASARLSLRRQALDKTGLPAPELCRAGLVITERDEPLFEGSAVASAVPLAAAGRLLGILNLEHSKERQRERERDVRLLYRIANHASLALKGLRSLEELRAQEQAAEHAERLAGIGRLAAGIAHELNNPLTAVNLYSESLVEKFAHSGQDPADLEKLRAILEAGRRIQKLARDLLAYARPLGARPEPVDLAGAVEEAVRLAKPILKDRAAEMERYIDPSPPVEGHRASLVQLIVNLVTNAAQAVAAGGRVTVKLAPDERGVRLTVEDDGKGMAPEVAARAFEPFFTTRGGDGIGLGLPIVQGIVRRHGGAVELESAPGAGTKVTVWLPRIPVPERRP